MTRIVCKRTAPDMLSACGYGHNQPPPTHPASTQAPRHPATKPSSHPPAFCPLPPHNTRHATIYGVRNAHQKTDHQHTPVLRRDAHPQRCAAACREVR